MSEVRQLSLPTATHTHMPKALAAQSAGADAADAFAQLARTNTQPRLWRKCPPLPPHTVSCLRWLTHSVLHFLCRLQERKGKRVRTEGANLGADEMEGVDAMEPAALKALEEEEDSDDEVEFMAQMQQNAMQSLAKPAGEPDKFEVASPDKGKIAVGMTVYVMATKIGGLSKDNIVAVIAASLRHDEDATLSFGIT